MITIVNYGMGNLGSVQNMFKYIGVESIITGDLDKIRSAEKLLLPGVGAFDAAMEQINNQNLKEVLDQKVLEEKVPVLGICLGMQLLVKGSDEGKLPGLGWIPARAIKFEAHNQLKVPHMGWNEVTVSNSSALTGGLDGLAGDDENARFYFVHSYHVQVEDEKYSMLKTNYGLSFDSGIHHENIYGCQFHPEKSHKYGMHLLKNFAAIQC